MRKKLSIGNYQLAFTNRGFTLMELMVVVAIIALLAGIMVPNVAKRLEKAKMTKAEADIAAIESAIAMYENDTGRYPEDTQGTWSTIQVLAWRLTGRDPISGATDPLIVNDSKWHGPYIKGIEEDSWKEEYVYVKNTGGAGSPPAWWTAAFGVGDGGCVAPPENLGYYIYSMGKNKLTASTGDGQGYDDDPDDGDDNDDDINNWDVKKSWQENY